MSMLFRLRKKGTSNVNMLFADNRQEAVMKLQQLVRSRKMLTVKDPILRPVLNLLLDACSSLNLFILSKNFPILASNIFNI